MTILANLVTPQLQKIHSGKVRESFRIDPARRLIVATDRISSFDQVLKTPVPGKGAVLNSLAAFWFSKTRKIIDNHFIELIDPNISLVREAKPIKVEMIVRGYLTGSAWRGYEKGKRVFSGVSLPDGLTKNQRFDQPIVTPTTKEESDREISPRELVEEGWVSAELYEQMEAASLKLFAFGEQFLKERGILLIVDEVQTGVFRTGEFLASQVYGVQPDIVTLAKGLAGGVPIGAVVTTLKDVFSPGDHGSTFGGNFLAASAGLKVLELLVGIKDSGALKATTDYFAEKVKSLAENHGDLFKEHRGLGLMQGLVMATDDAVKAVVDACFDQGLLVLKSGRATLRFLPPLTIERTEIDEGFARLERALD